MRFSMKGVKLVNIPFAFHSNISSSLCLVYKKEKVMSHIPYGSTIGGLMNEMKWSNISHTTGVVSEHMRSPSEAVKWVHNYFKGTSVTYSGCSDLVYGSYFAASVDKRRSTLGYISKYYFGRQVIDGGGVVSRKVHTQENCTYMFMNPILLEKLEWCVTSLGL